MCMTRILTETYHCGNCGHSLTKRTFGQKQPRMELCYACGYVGEDLSLPPSEEVLALLDSKEYHRFFENMFPVNGTAFFLGGYLCSKLREFEKAIFWYAQALSFGSTLKGSALDNLFFETLVFEKGVNDDYVLSYGQDYQEKLYASYVCEMLYECGQELDFEYDGPFLASCYLIDACRRNGHFEEAMASIAHRQTSEADEANRALLEMEAKLCQALDAKTKVELPEFPYQC